MKINYKKEFYATTNYLVVPDKKELMELLTETKEEGNEDDIDATLHCRPLKERSK